MFHNDTLHTMPPAPSDEEIRQAVVRALERLKIEDAHLFKVGISERSLTFRLSLYLRDEFDAGWRVDCEYNRDGKYPKRLDAVRAYRITVDPNSKSHGDVY